MLGNPNNVNDYPGQQLRSELGILDKTQKMTNMMNILDAYIIRHTLSSGGTRKNKHKKVRKIRKSRKIRKIRKIKRHKKDKNQDIEK